MGASFQGAAQAGAYAHAHAAVLAATYAQEQWVATAAADHEPAAAPAASPADSTAAAAAPAGPRCELIDVAVQRLHDALDSPAEVVLALTHVLAALAAAPDGLVTAYLFGAIVRGGDQAPPPPHVQQQQGGQQVSTATGAPACSWPTLVDALAAVWGEAHRRLANACPHDAGALAEAVAAMRLDLGVQSVDAAEVEAALEAAAEEGGGSVGDEKEGSRLGRMFRPASRAVTVGGAAGTNAAGSGGPKVFTFGGSVAAAAAAGAAPRQDATGGAPRQQPLSPLAAAATGRLSPAARTLLAERRQLLESYVLLQEFVREVTCLLEAKAMVRLTVLG
jgi:hypothetical protein